MKKIYVMIGNYGSGKSELALNFAFKAAETGKTELIDLDLVNTYFRLTERGKLVEQKEIRLISPNYACSGVETLSLPAEVASAFAMNWDTVVFDVGGDAVGSTALGRYYEDFQDFMAMGPEQLEVLNVVNIRRPLAGTVEKIIDLQQQMEIHSHLKITGMTCGHCERAVINAIKARDAEAQVKVDLDSGSVQVESVLSEAVIREVIEEEGYKVG